MVATSAFRSVRMSDPPLRISVDDILLFAERERVCHSARGRRQAMTKAQSSTHKLDDVVRSRPHTSASRYLTSVRRETMTPKSLRSEPMPSRVSSRMADYVDEDDIEDVDDYPINVISSPTPICCEVIGPQTCNECLKLHRRRVNKQMSDARFSSMTVSDQNITTATMLQRYFPKLSIEEIQMKLIRGEIARPKLPYHKFDNEQSERKSKAVVSSRMKQNITRVTSSLFFVNIQDLNHRITSGKVSRTLGFTHKPRPRRATPESKESFPLFISPRKQAKISEKSSNDRRSFPFDPPLLAKRNQKPEPPFFAGSDKPYKLPQKLPDTIEFVENGVTKRSVSVLSEVASEFSFTEDTKTENVSENVEVREPELLKRSVSVLSDNTITEESIQEAIEHVQKENGVVPSAHDDEEYAGSDDRSDAKTPTPSLEDDFDDDDVNNFAPELDVDVNW